MKKNRYYEVYPGIDNRFVICHVCGMKFRVRDTVRISDPYNLLNGMIVCKEDADKTNPQIKPIRIHDDLLKRKDYVSPEAPYFSYTNLENQDTIGSAPRFLTAEIIAMSDGITLTWQGALDYGNALHLGYRIYRADNVKEQYYIIEENTQSLATYYLDTTTVSGNIYSYVVTAITDLGESAPSNIAYFPYRPDITYLMLDQTIDNADSFPILDQNDGFLIIDQLNV